MARGLWINVAPQERSLVKFHLSEFRIWKEFSPWGNRGSTCSPLAAPDENPCYLSSSQLTSDLHVDGTE